MFNKFLIGAVLAMSIMVSNVQSMEFSAAVDGADSVRGGVDLSQHYAQLPEVTRNGIRVRHDFYESRIPSVIRSLELAVEKKVLDIGTGSGVAARVLKRKGFEVTAVDPDLNEISVGYYLGEFDGVDLYPTTLQDLPVELNGTFDVAVYCHFLVDYSDRPSFFERLAHLMKDSGEVHLFFADDDYNVFNYDGVMSDLMRAKFKSVAMDCEERTSLVRLFIPSEFEASSMRPSVVCVKLRSPIV